MLKGKELIVFEILTKLYDSEINYQMSTYWDGGIDVKYGDEQNGFKEEATFQEKTSSDDLIASVMWLSMQALKHAPSSTFAKWYCETFECTIEDVVLNKVATTAVGG